MEQLLTRPVPGVGGRSAFVDCAVVLLHRLLPELHLLGKHDQLQDQPRIHKGHVHDDEHRRFVARRLDASARGSSQDSASTARISKLETLLQGMQT